METDIPPYNNQTNFARFVFHALDILHLAVISEED